MEGARVISRRGLERVAGASLAAICLVACGQHDPLAFPDYSGKLPTPPPLAAGSNAYDNYQTAAQDFDRTFGTRAEKLAAKPAFSQNERIGLQKQTKDAIQSLHLAVAKSCEIPMAADLKGRSEWRVLSEVLRWDIEDACSNEDYSTAVSEAIIATKFGFDLTGGSPSDASLGFVILDDARRTIAPYLSKMNPQQLSKLSGEIKKIYSNRPKIDGLMQNISAGMLDRVQEVQTAYQRQSYDALSQELGDDAKEPIQYLKDLHNQGDGKRFEFFDSFAAEARTVGGRLVKNCNLPAVQRTPLEPLKTIESKPWKRFAVRFFHDGDSLLAMNDQAVARTRLLILDAQIQISLKTEDHTPRDLTKFTKELTIDPYSGDLMVYHTDGRDYKLYSVGPKPAGGDSPDDPESTFRKPDLALETES